MWGVVWYFFGKIILSTLWLNRLVEPVLNNFTVSQYNKPDKWRIQHPDNSFNHQMWGKIGRQHLNCSLSKYCAQSSFSPNQPVCQLINLLALYYDLHITKVCLFLPETWLKVNERKDFFIQYAFQTKDLLYLLSCYSWLNERVCWFEQSAHDRIKLLAACRRSLTKTTPNVLFQGGSFHYQRRYFILFQ